MSKRRLSFYDHDRQNYADVVPVRGLHDHEIMVGDYVGDGGVGARGELSLCLHRFSRGATPFWSERSDSELSVQVCVFGDAHGTLRELERLGVMRDLDTRNPRRPRLRTADDVSRMLIARGLRDVSDKPMSETQEVPC